MISTERYHEYPMIIKGYGAGADVTAAGVLPTSSLSPTSEKRKAKHALHFTNSDIPQGAVYKRMFGCSPF